MDLFDYKLDSKTGLYSTKFDSGYVVWKALPWGQFKKYREAKLILGPLADVAIQEKVYRECVVFSSFDNPPPETMDELEAKYWTELDRDNQTAGIKQTIVSMIMHHSGISHADELEDALEEARESLTIEDSIAARICAFFHAYTPEMLEELSWGDVMKRLAQTEQISGSRIDFKPVEAEKTSDEIQEQKRRLNEIIEKVHRGEPVDPFEEANTAAPTMNYEQFVESRKTLRSQYQQERRGR